MKTLEALRVILDERFNGVIYSGTHRPDGKCCLLEFASQAKGIPWTDSPAETGYPDLRPLNDAPWSSDEVRTQAMLPLLVSLAWWADADEARRKRFTNAVALRTIREVLPIALRAAGLELSAVRCESAKDLAEASAAVAVAVNAADAARAVADAVAYADAAYAVNDAAYAAVNAADAARAAARAAAYVVAAANAARAATVAYAVAYAVVVAAAAADKVLTLTCLIWHEEGLRA